MSSCLNRNRSRRFFLFGRRFGCGMVKVLSLRVSVIFSRFFIFFVVFLYSKVVSLAGRRCLVIVFIIIVRSLFFWRRVSVVFSSTILFGLLRCSL